MSTEFFTFGEILWDCLPSGRHAGGAPFNVAAHLAQLGCPVSLISSIGQDALGDEILKVARDKRVNTEFVQSVRKDLGTGTVLVTLDANSNASYEIVQPAAWDEISVTRGALDAVGSARAFVFGSLAGRSAHNLKQLDRLLQLGGPLKFFDVNLREPFIDPRLVVELAGRADVIKLNDDEIGRLASWVETGKMTPNTPKSAEALAGACGILQQATRTACICVTRGAEGAGLWEDGRLLCAPAPPVRVKDTVGAGDAFMAGLVAGLTRGKDKQKVLEIACQLGAYVASHHGATPLLPSEIIEEFRTS